MENTGLTCLKNLVRTLDFYFHAAPISKLGCSLQSNLVYPDQEGPYLTKEK